MRDSDLLAANANWRKAKARLAKVHTRVANVRRDAHHKLAHRLVREFDRIGIEGPTSKMEETNMKLKATITAAMLVSMPLAAMAGNLEDGFEVWLKISGRTSCSRSMNA